MDAESKKLQNEILYYTRLLENHKKLNKTKPYPTTKHSNSSHNNRSPYTYKNGKNLNSQTHFKANPNKKTNQYKWKSDSTVLLQQQQKLEEQCKKQQQQLKLQQQKRHQEYLEQQKLEQQRKSQHQELERQQLLRQQKQEQQKKIQQQTTHFKALSTSSMQSSSSSSESMSSITPITKTSKQEFLWCDKYIGSPAIVKTATKFVSPGKRSLTRMHSGSRANISKNKYKVVRKENNTTNSSTTLNTKSQNQFQTQKFRRYLTNTQRDKYKFIQARPPLTTIQTRSSKTGNIVLKRNINNKSSNKVATAFKLAPAKYHNNSLKQKLASQAVQKSLQTVRKNRHKLKRTYCLYFNRFGKCKRGNKCQFTHDPERVALCTQFLRGTCRNENCLFSHKISKEKMPVCQFFVHGKCSTKDCPYLHVFVGHNAPVCRPFATTGYCPRAENCKQKHLRVCPDFYDTGKCKKGNSCGLPHKQPTKRKRTKSLSKKEAKTEPLKLKPRTSVQTKKELKSGFIRLLPKSQIVVTEKSPKTKTSNAQVLESDVQIQPRLKARKIKVN